MTRAALVAAAALAIACSGGGITVPPPSPGTVALASADVAAGEASATVTFTVHRTGGASGAASVAWSLAPGSALAWQDYEDDAGVLAWADGDTGDRTITVWLLDDALVEGDEAFSLALASPTGGVALGTRSATVTIRDDETPAAGALRFSAAPAQVDEGAAAATVQVERSGGAAGAVSVICATGAGTATADADYAAAYQVLSWADGDATPRTLTVPILDDALPEPYETVPIELRSATGGAAIGGPAAVTLTIRNDDTTVRLDAAVWSVAENGATLWVPATKVGETAPVTVEYVVTGGTATPGADFTVGGTTLSWGDRQTGTLRFALVPVNDALQEGPETVVLALANPTGGATLAAPSSGTITIVDDEPPPAGLLEFARADHPVSNYAGAVTIAVRRRGGTVGAVSVSYATADGTATAGQDYTAAAGTLTWDAGDGADRTFTIEIADDLVDEAPETIALALSGPTGGAALGPRQTATVTISDDWTRHGSPVFSDSAAGWDETAVSAPSVVRLATGSFVMYYQGERNVGGQYVRQIGRAVSADGITWTRDPATPVLGAGELGKFDEFGVGKPSVLFDGTTWHMWYANQDRDVNHDVPAAPRIGYATSSDGVTWTRQNGGNAVLAGGPSAWDAYGVTGPAVILDGGTFKMWFGGFEYTDNFAEIGYATSSDGVAWTKHGRVLDTLSDSFDWVAVSDPAVVKDGSTYRMWYQTRTSSTWRTRYAESSDGTSWQRFPNAPIFDVGYGYWEYYGVQGPSVIRDGDRFLLWYFSEGLTPGPGVIGLVTNP